MSVKIERKIIGGWLDVTAKLKSGRLSYSREFSTFGSSEAVLDIYESDESTAYTNYPKKGIIRVSQTERAGQGFYDADVLLYGIIERHSWSEDSKSVRVTVKDQMYSKVQRKTDGLLFVGKTVTEIMAIIAAELDVSITYTPNASGSYTNPTVPYYYIKAEISYKEILTKIAEATGGRIYCSAGIATPTIVFEAGCLVADTSVYDPTPYLSLTADQAVNINIEYPPREYNAWTVDCFSKTVKTDTLYLATVDNEFSIPSEGIGAGDDAHYIEFEMPVLKIIENNLDFTGCPDVTFDATTYNANFIDDNPAGYLKNPLRVQVKFTNTSGFDRNLLYWNMKIQGVDEQKVEVSIDDSSSDDYKNEYKLQSDIIVENGDWNTRRLNWEKAFPQEELSFTIVDPSEIPLIGSWDGTHSDPNYTVDYDGAKIVPERLGYSIDRMTWEISGRADRTAFDSSVYDDKTTHGVPVPAAPEITIEDTPDAPTLSSEVRADNRVYLLITIADAGSYEVDIYNNTRESQQGLIKAESGSSPFVVAYRVNESESYKARIRISTSDSVSEWSDYSTNHTTTTSDVPYTPTLNALTKAYTYISIVTATWTHTKKDNHSHYEIEFYEGTGDQKKLIGIFSTVQQTFSLQVSEYVLVSVRVRAVDNEGKVSSWTEEQNITSSYDSTNPATPTTAVLVGCATGILFFWVASYDPKRLYFDVQRSYADLEGYWEKEWITKEDYFEDTTAVDGHAYWYRVRAVKANNVKSSWLTSSSSGTDILEGKISNFRVGNIDAGKITTGYLAAARIQANTIHASKFAAMSEDDDILAITNNVEIGAKVGPQEVGGIYIYDGGNSGSGFVLNSGGLLYTNGQSVLPILLQIVKDTLLFTTQTSLTEGIVVSFPFAIAEQKLSIKGSFLSFPVGSDAAQRRLELDPVYETGGKVEAVRAKAYKLSSTTALITSVSGGQTVGTALTLVVSDNPDKVSITGIYFKAEYYYSDTSAWKTSLFCSIGTHTYSSATSRTITITPTDYEALNSTGTIGRWKFTVNWGDSTSETKYSDQFTAPFSFPWIGVWVDQNAAITGAKGTPYYVKNNTKTAMECIVDLSVYFKGG